MSFPLLLAQALATFVASFATGYLPLVFRKILGEEGEGGGKTLKCVSVVGMGLLVGSALTIIIPEGVSTLYGSLPTTNGDSHDEGEANPTRWIGCSLLAGFALMLLVESLTPHPGDEADHEHSYDHITSHPGSPHAGSHPRVHHAHPHHHPTDPRAVSPTHPDSLDRDSTSSTAIFDAEQEEEDTRSGKGRFALRKTGGSGRERMAGWDEEQGMGGRGNVWMPHRDLDEETAAAAAQGQPFAGAAQGYVKGVPTTIDTRASNGGGGEETAAEIPPHLRMNSRTALFPARTTTQTRRHRDSNASTTTGGGSITDRCQEALGGASGQGVAGLNATLGLVIHALADGVALGASSLSGSGGLGLVVFLAVIVHKGPTALGLTTTLLSLNLTKKQIRTRLFVFSISAPLGAVVTYMIVKAVGAGQGGHTADQVDAIGWWTGVVLLFSGGSFLYVATVISPLSDSDAHGTHEHAHRGHHELPEDKLGQKTRLGLLLAGMVFPLALSALVGHAH